MRTHHDAKAMAKTLRDELKHHNLDLSHGQCLDIVARQFGLKDWNVLAAKVGSVEAPISSPKLLPPNGWFLGGTAAQLFNMGLDQSAPEADRSTLIIERPRGGDPVYWNAIGEMSQAFSAKDFIGHKVRLSAKMRTEDVTQLAVLYLRIVDANERLLGERVTRMNKPNGALQGTVNWTDRSHVLEVPLTADQIQFGFWMGGYGKAFARNFNFEIVANDEADDFGQLPSAPQNLMLAMA